MQPSLQNRASRERKEQPTTTPTGPLNPTAEESLRTEGTGPELEAAERGPRPQERETHQPERHAQPGEQGHSGPDGRTARQHQLPQTTDTAPEAGESEGTPADQTVLPDAELGTGSGTPDALGEDH